MSEQGESGTRIRLRQRLGRAAVLESLPLARAYSTRFMSSKISLVAARFVSRFMVFALKLLYGEL